MQKALGWPLSSYWVSTSDAAQELGISRGHLLHLKTDGTFKQGKHFRDVRRTNTNRATYKWNLPALQIILDKGPEVR
ncbi:hypothetical protein QUA71_06855 [Microcoleus sp. MON1_C5]|uniref:hypothetical protein n=1 Tax=Microcoleus sp. MON1_C5 TaxID=2818828 RepID=UPI002FD63723